MKKQHDNSWHFQNCLHDLRRGGYVEWKYFNFVTHDFAGIFIYCVFDPSGLTNISGGRVVARLFTPKGVRGGVQKIDISDVRPSKDSAVVQMGNGGIRINRKNYRIYGKADGVEWDLQYCPALQPIRGFSNINLDPIKLEKVSWFIQMPRAEVSGRIKIGNKNFYLKKVSGYSDANWGLLVPLASQFNWAQYNDKIISIVFGEIHVLKKWSGMYVTYKDERIMFGEDEFSIEHLEWKDLPEAKTKIPVVTAVKGENKDYKISIVLDTRQFDLLYFGMPLSFPLMPVVAEQVADFKGEFSRKEDGGQSVLHSFSGRGFKEYSMRRLSFSKKLKYGIVV